MSRTVTVTTDAGMLLDLPTYNRMRAAEWAMGVVPEGILVEIVEKGVTLALILPPTTGMDRVMRAAVALFPPPPHEVRVEIVSVQGRHLQPHPDVTIGEIERRDADKRVCRLFLQYTWGQP